MHALVIVVLAGFALNSHNTGGVESGKEAVQDIKAGIAEGYSKEEFVSFKLND